MDKEYILLNEIEKNENITQRELSKKAELSLGSVNLLINKMVQEGFIKIRQIPMNRVVYMLTPAGIAEKVKKTRVYIKFHYNFIMETTMKIESLLIDMLKQNHSIFIVLEHDEISELVKMSVNHINNDKIKLVDRHCIDFENHNFYENNIKNIAIIVLSTEAYSQLSQKDIPVISLLQLL